MDDRWVPDNQIFLDIITLAEIAGAFQEPDYGDLLTCKFTTDEFNNLIEFK